MITQGELNQIYADDPYMAGYAAQAAGLPRDKSNPAWQAGWDDAAADDKNAKAYCYDCGGAMNSGDHATISGKIYCRSCAGEPFDPAEAYGRDGRGFIVKDEFALQNAAPAPRKAKFESLGGRQKRLLDGMDCLPDQQDLF